MSRRVLKGCIATLAPAPVAKAFAAAAELGELQAVAQEHNGQLLEGLRDMCALVLQPAANVQVRGGSSVCEQREPGRILAWSIVARLSFHARPAAPQLVVHTPLTAGCAVQAAAAVPPDAGPGCGDAGGADGWVASGWLEGC